MEHVKNKNSKGGSEAGKLEKAGVNVDAYPQNPRKQGGVPAMAQQTHGGDITRFVRGVKNGKVGGKPWSHLTENDKLKRMGVNVDKHMFQEKKKIRDKFQT